ncbi:MAG TPA: glycoside hydrolase family 13 protein [Propionibacteriaceae bacterium]|nr:glycoside hydrolase family 13 protein [Propionibacteriaceae bacterium]
MTEIAQAYLPHHDGSELYRRPQAPQPGGTVELRLRTSSRAPVEMCGVRYVSDGEPRWAEARADAAAADGTIWWRTEIPLHNPVTHYRWIVRGGPLGYAWVNASGTHRRDVPDAEDFRVSTFAPPPAWSDDAVVYQIFPDRFARSDAADHRSLPDWALPRAWDDPIELDHGTIGRQFYGGDLDGIIEHLDHIVDLGVTVVYLTPIFPARSNHRYDASTFDHVDPLLGGDEAFARLVAACHERGLRVMGDVTTNHTGAGHEWFQIARSDPASEERSFYYFDDSETGYVGWLGARSLPKLNHASAILRERFFGSDEGVIRKWLRPPYGMDAWRVDVANMSGRYGAQDDYHEVARTMREAATAARPDAWVVAEHCHDLYRELDGDGWHGAMNYSGFTRPAWTWLRSEEWAPSFLGQAMQLPRLPGGAVVAAMRAFNAGIPWTAYAHSFDLLGSHDTTRLATLIRGDNALLEAAVTLMFTMPGVPMVCYGDEVGLEGTFGEDGRRTMPWAHPERWNERAHATYRDLAQLRRHHRALTHGGLRWLVADDDLIAYVRESEGETALVAVARAACGPVTVPLDAVAGADAGRLAFGSGITVDGDGVRLGFDGPGGGVLVW